MGIDWETLLGASGAALREAYDDCVARSDAWERGTGHRDRHPETQEQWDFWDHDPDEGRGFDPCEDMYFQDYYDDPEPDPVPPSEPMPYLHLNFAAEGCQAALEELERVVEQLFQTRLVCSVDATLCACVLPEGGPEEWLDLSPFDPDQPLEPDPEAPPMKNLSFSFGHSQRDWVWPYLLDAIRGAFGIRPDAIVDVSIGARNASHELLDMARFLTSSPS